MFLNGLGKEGNRDLLKRVMAIRGSTEPAQLITVLSEWFHTEPPEKIAAVVRLKIHELGLTITATTTDNAARTSSLASSNDDTTSTHDVAPVITYEDLPDDPTGQWLDAQEACQMALKIDPLMASKIAPSTVNKNDNIVA